MPVNVEHLADLAPDLERALGEDDSVIRVLSPELRLRTSLCGVVSETLRAYLIQHGIDAETRINPVFQHVITVSGDSSMIIDGTYSQFFGHYQMSMFRAKDNPDCQMFPEEKILVFAADDYREVADWATEIVMQFHRRAVPPEQVSPYAEILPTSPMPDFNRPAIRARFQELWNLDNYQPYQASESTRQGGERLLSRLLKID